MKIQMLGFNFEMAKIRACLFPMIQAMPKPPGTTTTAATCALKSLTWLGSLDTPQYDKAIGRPIDTTGSLYHCVQERGLDCPSSSGKWDLHARMAGKNCSLAGWPSAKAGTCQVTG